MASLISVSLFVSPFSQLNCKLVSIAAASLVMKYNINMIIKMAVLRGCLR
jgi:hypothetical protein